MTTTTRQRIRSLQNMITRAKQATGQVEAALYLERYAAPEYLAARLCAEEALEQLAAAHDHMRAAATRQINEEARHED